MEVLGWRFCLSSSPSSSPRDHWEWWRPVCSSLCKLHTFSWQGLASARAVPSPALWLAPSLPACSAPFQWDTSWEQQCLQSRGDTRQETATLCLPSYGKPPKSVKIHKQLILPPFFSPCSQVFSTSYTLSHLWEALAGSLHQDVLRIRAGRGDTLCAAPLPHIQAQTQMDFGQHTPVLPPRTLLSDRQKGNKLLISSHCSTLRRRELGFAGGVSSTGRDFGNGHYIQHPSSRSPCLKTANTERATPPKIRLLNCLKLNLKCMYAVFLSARYSELLLWPYDKRMQEIIANLPPARKRELITASTKSALFQ